MSRNPPLLFDSIRLAQGHSMANLVKITQRVFLQLKN
jgi:hypothetical protein